MSKKQQSKEEIKYELALSDDFESVKHDDQSNIQTVDNLHVVYTALFDELLVKDKRKTLAYVDRFYKHFTNLTYQQLQTYFNEEDLFALSSAHLKNASLLFLLNLKFAIIADFNKYTESTSQTAYHNSIAAVNFAKFWNSNNRLFFVKDDTEYHVNRNANLYTIKKKV